MIIFCGVVDGNALVVQVVITAVRSMTKLCTRIALLPKPNLKDWEMFGMPYRVTPKALLLCPL